MSTRAWNCAVVCKLLANPEDESSSLSLSSNDKNAKETVVASTEIKNAQGEIQRPSFGQIAQMVLLERSDWIIQMARRAKKTSNSRTTSSTTTTTTSASKIPLSVLFQCTERSCFLVLLDGAPMPRYMDKADLVVKMDYAVYVKRFKNGGGGGGVLSEQPLDHGKIHHGTCGKVLFSSLFAFAVSTRVW